VVSFTTQRLYPPGKRVVIAQDAACALEPVWALSRIEKSFPPAENRTQAVQHVTIPTGIARLTRVPLRVG
jgi:hypothetical protein